MIKLEMDWALVHFSRLFIKPGQMAQTVWLGFAALALSLAILGIPYYVELIQKPCDGANCFDAQLTMEAARAMRAGGKTLGDYALTQTAILLLIDGLLLSASIFLIWRKSSNRASILAAFAGTALATSTLSQALAHVDPRFAFPAQFILFVQMAGLLPLFCLFPDGHLQPHAMRWVVIAYVVANLVYLSPDYREWLGAATIGGTLWKVFVLVSVLTVITNLFYRFRHAPTFLHQEQMLWVLAGIALAGLVVLLGSPVRLPNFSLVPVEAVSPDMRTNIQIVGMFLAVGSFTCMLVALFNYEPVNPDIFINRTLVYGALTVCIIAVYGLIVGYLGNAFHSDNLAVSLIATGLVAILFQPLRERLQRGVNRLMYGERDEPYRVLTQLGQRLESAVERTAILPLTVETVARALKLPHVAILLKQEGVLHTVAVYGKPQNSTSKLPLVYAGETIGELVVGARSASEPLTDADRRLLSDLAPQVSVAAHSTVLAADLERARLRIVVASEEARRRLGSDLHDGVGHQLAGLGRKAEMAARLVEQDPASAQTLLLQMTQQLNAAMAEVRSLAHQLHPPELETLGLVDALRERAQIDMGNGLAIRIDAPGELPDLPTATETAAYYIALEALTNVEKHARARHCSIRLEMCEGTSVLESRTLEMEIEDDGRGPGDKSNGAGLGLLSMQARAAEVGGTCRFDPGPAGGTRVSVRIPIA